MAQRNNLRAGSPSMRSWTATTLAVAMLVLAPIAPLAQTATQPAAE